MEKWEDQAEKNCQCVLVEDWQKETATVVWYVLYGLGKQPPSSWRRRIVYTWHGY